MLKQNTTKKRFIDDNITKLDANSNNSNEYKENIICDSTVYTKESKSDHVPEFYYLVF